MGRKYPLECTKCGQRVHSKKERKTHNKKCPGKPPHFTFLILPKRLILPHHEGFNEWPNDRER